MRSPSDIAQVEVADASVDTLKQGHSRSTERNLNPPTTSGVGGSFTVGPNNQLTNAYLFGGNGNHDGTFDANGNLVTMNIDSSAFINSYFCDDENRLIYFTHSESGSALEWSGSPQNVNDRISEFHYDGQGRLRQRLEYAPDYYGYNWELSETVNYIYDGWRVIQERDANNTPTVSYTRGNDLSGTIEGAGGIGGLLARSTGNGTTWTSHAYYHADGSGNITFMLDGSQTMVASYRYDPFGNTLAYSGSLALANTYRFSSKELHVASGLYYYGHRWYSPSLQRWLNRDPIEEVGGINLYTYIYNDPPNKIDPFGLWQWGWPPWGKPKPKPPEPSYWDLVKQMADAVKKAAKDYEDGKCPKDPCKLPSSLNAICTCMYQAAKNKSVDDMIQCVCQASPDPDCERNARKALGNLFPK